MPRSRGAVKKDKACVVRQKIKKKPKDMKEPVAGKYVLFYLSAICIGHVCLGACPVQQCDCFLNSMCVFSWLCADLPLPFDHVSVILSVRIYAPKRRETHGKQRKKKYGSEHMLEKGPPYALLFQSTWFSQRMLHTQDHACI
jgi:hypothetical protein